MSFTAYSRDEIVDATERQYQALCVAHLLRKLGNDGDEINYMRLNDLGSLLVRLLDYPLEILNELRSDVEVPDPDPGKHKPNLVSINKKQDTGGAAK